MLKFVLAAPIDRWHLGRNNYRAWALLLSLGYTAALVLLAAHPIGETAYVLLFVLGRTVIPMLAGVMLNWQGYDGMLVGLMLGLVLVFFVTLNNRQRTCILEPLT